VTNGLGAYGWRKAGHFCPQMDADKMTDEDSKTSYPQITQMTQI
jgi:hypothetical protein